MTYIYTNSTQHPVITVSVSSPLVDDDDDDSYLVLPMSASDKTTFDGHGSQGAFLSFKTFYANTPLLWVMLMFPVSTALVYFALRSLPMTFVMPHNVSDLATLGREFHGYAQSGPWPMAHVIAVLSISAIWKHAWSFPGSIIWNVLAGALFPPAMATLLMTIITTIGALISILLAKPLSPLVTHFFPRALVMTRNVLEGDIPTVHASDTVPVKKASSSSSSPLPLPPSKTSPWVRLSVLRLIGVIPWSGINIACGLCGVPFWDCILSTFIGSLPWTAVTCQIGDILQTVASTPSPTPQSVTSLLSSPDIIIKLLFLSLLSLVPILGRERFLALVHQSRHRQSWSWKSRLNKNHSVESEELMSLVREKENLH